MVIAKAQERVGTRSGNPQMGLLRCPTQDPAWDPNNHVDMRALEQYRSSIIDGMRNAVPKSQDLSKITQIQQAPTESPSEYFARLREAVKRFSDLDPDDPGNRILINTWFVGGAQRDMKRVS